MWLLPSIAISGGEPRVRLIPQLGTRGPKGVMRTGVDLSVCTPATCVTAGRGKLEATLYSIRLLHGTILSGYMSERARFIDDEEGTREVNGDVGTHRARDRDGLLYHGMKMVSRFELYYDYGGHDDAIALETDTYDYPPDLFLRLEGSLAPSLPQSPPPVSSAFRPKHCNFFRAPSCPAIGGPVHSGRPSQSRVRLPTAYTTRSKTSRVLHEHVVHIFAAVLCVWME